MTTLDAPRIAQPMRRLTKGRRGAAWNECDLSGGVCPVAELREALAREAALLRERDALLDRQAALSRESEHRFLNNLQMVSSLLSLQSRGAANAEAASACALVADRVSTIGPIHRLLHSHDGVDSVAFKRFLEELCRDVMVMMSAEDCVARVISVEGVELQPPTTIGIPLGFVASELITNALKYGVGPITVRLALDQRKGCLLSVENVGPALPEGVDPTRSKGLGMRIIRSFVGAFGGELCIDRGESNQSARFTVLFAATS